MQYRGAGHNHLRHHPDPLVPSTLTRGWLHAKLLLVIVLLYLHYRRDRRILSLEKDPFGASAGEFKMIHGLVGPRRSRSCCSRGDPSASQRAARGVTNEDAAAPRRRPRKGIFGFNAGTG